MLTCEPDLSSSQFQRAKNYFDAAHTAFRDPATRSAAYRAASLADANAGRKLIPAHLTLLHQDSGVTFEDWFLNRSESFLFLRPLNYPPDIDFERCRPAAMRSLVVDRDETRAIDELSISVARRVAYNEEDVLPLAQEALLLGVLNERNNYRHVTVGTHGKALQACSRLTPADAARVCDPVSELLDGGRVDLVTQLLDRTIEICESPASCRRFIQLRDERRPVLAKHALDFGLRCLALNEDTAAQRCLRLGEKLAAATGQEHGTLLADIRYHLAVTAGRLEGIAAQENLLRRLIADISNDNPALPAAEKSWQVSRAWTVAAEGKLASGLPNTAAEALQTAAAAMFPTSPSLAFYLTQAAQWRIPMPSIETWTAAMNQPRQFQLLAKWLVSYTVVNVKLGCDSGRQACANAAA